MAKPSKMDDEDDKIPTPGDKGETPSGRRPSDSPSPMEEMAGGVSAGGEDAPTTSASQERLNISPNESRNSQKSLFCASSSGGASTPSETGSVGRPGSGSGGETIVIGSSSASSSQSSASTTPTASTPGEDLNVKKIIVKPEKIVVAVRRIVGAIIEYFLSED